ncbi:MAG: biotin--[acetyl-CoA-carboxylase] ligase [Myxococcota bacterium]
MKPLRVDSVQDRLQTRWLGRSLSVKTSTESTNDDAREALDSGAIEGHVILAEHQTRGRGSRGRKWESPSGQDLYLSIVYRPSLGLDRLPCLALTVGLGVCDAVHQLLGRPAEVKWPNDVLLDRDKCAGILIESASTGHQLHGTILGIGLNVNRTHFSAELEGQATSLAIVAKRSFDRCHVLCLLLRCVESRLDELGRDGPETILDQLEPLLAYRGAHVEIQGVRGIALGLSNTGGFRVRQSDGTVQTLHSGVLEPKTHPGA